MTIKEKLIAALKARGFKAVESRTRKYEVFKGDGDKLIFVGKAGALRIGKTVTDSIPSERFKAMLLTEAK